ncbi:hypothetical protein KXV55_002483 [Aspergillus fumigatus]|uniref:Azaphilone pigments biosynthesis cluster protein L N-terminal domain-containing protein n=2 Tax=Aspergillus subgen. Fumigati TaxID=2720872 RepID=A0A421D612_9EURO|nr:hypothetical protein CNMCM8927_003580 [Aspergillus lentulus]KAH3511111.1 hypothetical protein KXV55_002483 [Aspergillus fumigatus]RLL97556.1 hypothetical protein CFD26_104268 [Aspergillus turcosus]
MAEAIGLASSLVALAGFAFQASKSLYQVLESFKSTKRTVRELRHELDALNQVIEELQKVAVDHEKDLSTLKLPLLRCGKTCEEFEDAIEKCAPRSDVQRPRIIEWARLQYMGGDISNLKATLSGYKATISIALGGATFRKTAVTSSVLEEYKQMIAETTSDLQDHLLDLDSRVQSLQWKGSLQSAPNELEEIREEKASTEQCLNICAGVSEAIEAFEKNLSLGSDAHSASRVEQKSSAQARIITKAMLTEFQVKLLTSRKDFESRMKELDRRLHDLSEKGPQLTREEALRLESMKEERDSISQCLNICTDASDLAGNPRVNIFENIKSADDSHQLVVSTIGDLISAKHITTGARSAQWFGQMSDETLQQLSRNHKLVPPEEKEPGLRVSHGFREKYGAGYKLDHSQNKGKNSHSGGS